MGVTYRLTTFSDAFRRKQTRILKLVDFLNDKTPILSIALCSYVLLECDYVHIKIYVWFRSSFIALIFFILYKLTFVGLCCLELYALCGLTG